MPDQTALHGVRVIDLSEGIAGPFATKLLAAAGAEVIKVEPPAGDVSRQYGPFPGGVPHPEKSGLFLHLNTGKLSVTLDLAREGDRAELRRLLAGADLLVESFPPGHLDALGLGFEQLKGEFPRLSVVSVTPFGQSGPYRAYRAPSALIMALTAIMYQSGDPDKAPLATAGDPVEYFAGYTAWLASLAALFHRDQTGAGQHVDVSHWESMGAADDFTTTLYAFMGGIRRRFHSRQILTYPGDLLPCRNGHIMVTGGYTGFPTGLAILLERPELLDHPLFNDTWARVLNPEAFDAIIVPWLLEHDWQEIFERAQELRIPFAPCLGPGELLENDHLRAREFFVQLDHPDAGPLPYAGAPFRMSETPLRWTRAPRLGEHNGEFKVQSSKFKEAALHFERGTLNFELPLRGVRVLDLSHIYAGPTCARLLADLGADVIKVEGFTRMDGVRGSIMPENDPSGDWWNRAGYFLPRNLGKRSLALDFSKPEGLALLRRLVPLADVLIESFTPRVLRNLGLDYPRIRELNDDLIMISLSGYGQTGPWAEYSAFGYGLEPASGIAWLNGYPGGPPIRTHLPFNDPLSGIVGAGAVLTALHHHRRTGRGQHIDLSQHEAGIPLVGAALMAYAMNGAADPWLERLGDASPRMAPHGCYPCRGWDQWLAIACPDQASWRALCAAAGHAEWAEEARFREPADRLRHRAELDGLIAAWTSNLDKHAAMHALQAAGVPATAVLNAKEMVLDPHLRERGYLEYIDQPGCGRRPYPRHLGAQFSAFATPAAGPSPTLGQHNREVLTSLLGLSEAEIARLEADAVIGTEPVTPVGVDAALLQAIRRLPLNGLIGRGYLLPLDSEYKEVLGIE